MSKGKGERNLEGESVKKRRRGTLLKWNTFFSLVCQITAIVSGFIIPRLILRHYGSEINGLVNSVTQFLRFITFMDFGVDAVIRSSFYKPLADKDKNKISQIVVSGNRFFNIFALVSLVYIIGLIIFFPSISSLNFSRGFIVVLIVVMSIETFAQYYFGMVDGLLLVADQKGYIFYLAKTISIMVNTIACLFLIEIEMPIQFVKLITSIIFLVRPLVLIIYVKKHYDIDRKATYVEEPIKQKWNGVYQHVATIVLYSTDAVILTLFSTLVNVSIYSVYSLVVNGVQQLFSALTDGMQSLLGDMWAKRETEKLKSGFSVVEWGVHTGVTLVFSCTGILLVSFIRVYTSGITDANYIQPIFSAILAVAYAVNCIRVPYRLMIRACGHYKETQNIYIISTIINIVISILAVKNWGLVGVAVGTLIAMLYQVIYMAIYNSKNFIKWPIQRTVKQCMIDIFTAFVCVGLSKTVTLNATGYFGWFLQAALIFLISLIVVVCVNYIFYKDVLLKIKDILILRRFG